MTAMWTEARRAHLTGADIDYSVSIDSTAVRACRFRSRQGNGVNGFSHFLQLDCEIDMSPAVRAGGASLLVPVSDHQMTILNRTVASVAMNTSVAIHMSAKCLANRFRKLVQSFDHKQLSSVLVHCGQWCDSRRSAARVFEVTSSLYLDVSSDQSHDNWQIDESSGGIPMILVRQVFQAKYGRGDELVSLFREFNKRMAAEEAGYPGFRILTDASGQFFRVVTEVELENFAEWEDKFSASMAKPWIGEWFSKTADLVDTGSREFFNIVE